MVYNGKPTRDWLSREDAASPTAVGRYGQMDRRTNLLENLLSHMDTDMIWRMMLMLGKLWFEGVALENRKEYSEAGMPSWRK
eukprot:scaffold1078_cov88-Cylindrotheca_fusiformis.AAC.1